MSEDKATYNPSERMMNLKGKDYLPVAERIVWFRNDYPEGTIETTQLELDRTQGFCMYRARVATGQGGFAEATGTETAKDFGDYIEKSETKAVGRALGYLGYGTAAAGFEEGHRPVDAPQDIRASKPARPASPAAPASAQPDEAPAPDVWTAIWSEARKQGIRDRDGLNQLMGAKEWQPADALAKLRKVPASNAG